MAIVTRRRLLTGLGAVVLAGADVAAPLMIARPARAEPERPRELRLYNTHTGETYRDVYHDGREVIFAQHMKLNRFLRDHHSDAATVMDPALFDMLWRLRTRYAQVHGRDIAINIHSAFRTHATNERLRAEGAAPNSFHKSGRALDISVQGLGIHFLANRVREVGAGGIGTYWRGRFVHIDTGPQRQWYRRV